MKPKAALLIVDVQNDFCPGGALPVPEGDQVVPVLNSYLQLFQQQGLPIFASRDWHPADSLHFREKGGLWPMHCVQQTDGAMFQADLKLPRETVVISKGTAPGDDGYSALKGTAEDGSSLAELLGTQGVERLYVGGLATDYCVKASVLEALLDGFGVTVLEDAVRAVNLKQEDAELAVAAMVDAGAQLATLETVAETLG
jgi:nicotinamidase/pyrazinamidase